MSSHPNEERCPRNPRLRTVGGLSHGEATALVDAVLAGAFDHAFELINGSGVPRA
jgi:hypothetical protein